MRVDPKQMVELLRDAGYEPRSYSGRGMFGRSCVAVEVSNGMSSFKLAAELCREALGMLSEEEAHDFIDALADVDASEDAMGLDSVVYWPRVAWPEAEDDDEEHDCEGPSCCTPEDPHAVARVAQFERSPQT